jgi:hypothetical protein
LRKEREKKVFQGKSGDKPAQIILSFVDIKKDEKSK